MYLMEVILDGFKSYATRTVVSGFDPAFNAITGLNGSGKSNILDSICFVMGITNLSAVRAGSLQELVYKQGQAGVSKATVTLVFNNEDTAASPVGYEGAPRLSVTRQVVLGGRNKYLINGHVAQPARVASLFHSVQLNVNNPHFLIMQGRITKVINMKPPAVLALVEEAAGTRMYEVNKAAALRTIARKDRKVEEIDALLEGHITPSLERLRRERAAYMAWAAANTTADALERFTVAASFSHASSVAELSTGQAADLQAQLATLEGKAEELSTRLEDATATLRSTTAARSSSGATAVATAESAAEAAGRVAAKATSAATAAAEAAATEVAAADALSTAAADARATLADRRTAAEAAATAATAAAAEEVRTKAAADAAQRALLTGTSGGVDGGDGEGGGGGGAVGSSAVDRLEAAKRAAAEAATRGEAARLDLAAAKAELKRLRGAVRADKAAADAAAAELAAAEAAARAADVALADVDFDAAAAEATTARRRAAEAGLAARRDALGELSARLAGVGFDYADPEPRWDRRRVRGRLAELVRVPEARWTGAVEVAAGGRLYQVVVDTDGTAKAILRGGRLRQRVTLLPLNKVDGKAADGRVVAAAAAAAPGTRLALAAVAYDGELEGIMRHVFGRTLLVEALADAQRVTFDPRVRLRSVTLEGDVFDPAGTLSGGGGGGAGGSQGPRDPATTLLGRLAARDAAEAEIAALTRSLATATAEEAAAAGAAEAHRKATAAAELARQQVALVTARLRSSATGRLVADLEAAETSVATTLPAAIAAAATDEAAAKAEADRLAAELEDADGAREAAVAAATAAVATATAAAAAAADGARSARSAAERAAMQVDALATEAADLDARLAAAGPVVEAAKAKADVTAAKATDAKAAADEAAAALADARARLASADAAVGRASAAVADLTAQREAADLDRRRLSHAHAAVLRDGAAAKATVASLRRKHPWIEAEAPSFGVAGGEYDFQARSPAAAAKELTRLRDVQAGAGKRVNKKAMALTDKAEAETAELLRKKGVVEKDKATIQDVIAELDEKKAAALTATWKKVDADFGSIFTTLLPGTSAALRPPEGATGIEAGLEIRVAFGGVWKASLSELSGGQRSLIALSLILALLRFKPAPVYILDEVDAALDLSHTQNIGRMLRTHFRSSQFLVVSLKEGMFANANVIFRTRFVEGVSTVSRTVNRVEGRTVGGGGGTGGGRRAPPAARRAAAGSDEEGDGDAAGEPPSPASSASPSSTASPAVAPSRTAAIRGRKRRPSPEAGSP